MSDSLFLERRTVSRKTPGNGRLEITKHAAQQIEALRPPIRIDLNGAVVPASLGTMACTCRGAENPHVHYFLESEHFRQLQPGIGLDLTLDAEGRRVLVRPAAED